MAPEMSIEAVLARLVGFPTISDRSNLALIDFVEDYLRGFGLTPVRVPDPTGEKASLYVRIGPERAGGTVLSAHTDVVPTEGQRWSADPFQLREAEGRLYGRGTCDMKGFLAVVLALVPQMVAAELSRPIDLAFSYDEETGCRGVAPLITALRAAHAPAGAVIVGEPTEMTVVSSHKSVAEIDVRITGHPVHSSILHTGVSAIEGAAALINWIGAMNEANRRAAAARPADDPDAAFDPAWSTLHCGVISGGTAHNITAKDCAMMIDIRSLPSEPLPAWIARLRAEAARITEGMAARQPGTGIAIDVLSEVPACRPEPDGRAEALVRRLTGDNGQHVMPFGTEAGLYQDAGYSTVVCGPGSVHQAHQADEFVTRAQLAAAERMIRALIADHSRPG